MQAVSFQTSLFPADKAEGVNPDTHLVLTFPSTPTLGTSGQIRIYDAADNRLVDTLDLSILPGPTTVIKPPTAPPYTPVPYEYVSGRFTNANTKPGTPSGVALPTLDIYQLTIIGGFTDAFHFYPVIIHDTVATIYPHNNLLDYDKTYYVQIDPGVLTLNDGSFSGIAGKTGWTFTTKKAPPPTGSKRLVVCGDGTGDFNTVQGAIDFVHVLGGWTPAMSPLILSPPAAVSTTAGQTAIFSVKAAAIPAATYQWFKNRTAISGATDTMLKIENICAGDAASYTVTVMNGLGCVTSQAAALMVK